MHHHQPVPVVHPYPINRDQIPDKNAQAFDGAIDQTDCPVLSDDYDLDVGLAGALQ